MVKYCKNCGSELEEGSLFCSTCGYSVDGVSQDDKKFSINNPNNPFAIYKLNMIEGEEIIRISEINTACLFAPGILIAIGIIVWFVSVISNFWYFGPFIFIQAILLNPLLIIGIIWFIIRYISYVNTELILTNKRVFGKCGLISTTQMQSPLNMINSVSFNTGLIGKLLGYGTVTVTTASTAFRFRFISDGHTLYNDIFNQLEIANDELIQKQADAIADAISKNN
ncbi:MAG: PH domain-containing protein [Methanobrevibacter sp.]|nr:PH domain-containing protein [Methanobrevibacter sp.]